MMAPGYPTPEEDVAAILRVYRLTRNIKRTARSVEVNPRTVYRILDAHGVERPRVRRYTDEEVAEAASRRRAGESWIAIERALGREADTVRRKMRQLALEAGDNR